MRERSTRWRHIWQTNMASKFRDTFSNLNQQHLPHYIDPNAETLGIKAEVSKIFHMSSLVFLTGVPFYKLYHERV